MSKGSKKKILTEKSNLHLDCCTVYTVLNSLAPSTYLLSNNEFFFTRTISNLNMYFLHIPDVFHFTSSWLTFLLAFCGNFQSFNSCCECVCECAWRYKVIISISLTDAYLMTTIQEIDRSTVEKIKWTYFFLAVNKWNFFR